MEQGPPTDPPRVLGLLAKREFACELATTRSVIADARMHHPPPPLFSPTIALGAPQKARDGLHTLLVTDRAAASC